MPIIYCEISWPLPEGLYLSSNDLCPFNHLFYSRQHFIYIEFIKSKKYISSCKQCLILWLFFWIQNFNLLPYWWYLSFHFNFSNLNKRYKWFKVSGFKVLVTIEVLLCFILFVWLLFFIFGQHIAGYDNNNCVFICRKPKVCYTHHQSPSVISATDFRSSDGFIVPYFSLNY